MGSGSGWRPQRGAGARRQRLAGAVQADVVWRARGGRGTHPDTRADRSRALPHGLRIPAPLVGEETVELLDVPEPSRCAHARDHHVLARHAALRDGRLQLAHGPVHVAVASQGLDGPRLDARRARRGMHLEQVPTLRALDRRAARRHQRLVELVARVAAFADDVHPRWPVQTPNLARFSAEARFLHGSRASAPPGARRAQTPVAAVETPAAYGISRYVQALCSTYGT